MFNNRTSWEIKHDILQACETPVLQHTILSKTNTWGQYERQILKDLVDKGFITITPMKTSNGSGAGGIKLRPHLYIRQFYQTTEDGRLLKSHISNLLEMLKK